MVLPNFGKLEGTTKWSVFAFLHGESNHGWIAITTNANLLLQISLLAGTRPDKTARKMLSWIRMVHLKNKEQTSNPEMLASQYFSEDDFEKTENNFSTQQCLH